MTTINATDASNAATPTLWWVSQDGQSSLSTGGATASDALAELLDECGTNDDVAGIMAGHFIAGTHKLVAEHGGTDATSAEVLGEYFGEHFASEEEAAEAAAEVMDDLVSLSADEEYAWMADVVVTVVEL